MTNKERYRQLCEAEPTIPIFSQAWWLDAVAGDAWDVVLVGKGSNIDASLPYLAKRRYGFVLVTQPMLTQSLGPWLRPSKAKYARRLSQEKDLLQSLFSELPTFSRYQQNWHFSKVNWLPLYWQGYKQTTRYTYRIDKLDDLDAVWKSFEANIRTDIRKATDRENLKVRTDLPVADFLKLNEKVFARQGLALPYSKDLVIRIENAAQATRSCRLFIAEDVLGRHHAGVYLIWDQNSAYYLMGGGDPDLRNSGATSLCMWHAIQFASTVTKSFDFEGSMMEPVERFFRGFGAIQVPYFSISKTSSPLLKIIMAIQNFKSDI